LRSEKTIVTTFRISCGGRASASCVPHAKQNRAISGFSTPQEGHTFTGRVYEPRCARLRGCENARVATDAALLAHAAELERRDDAVARELDTARRLEERAAAVRARAGEVRAALERIPAEFEELARRLADARVDEAAATAALARGEERLAELETARRKRVDEIERARSEVATARDVLADARANVARIASQDGQLRADERALAGESDSLLRSAGEVAADIGRFERVTESAHRRPGDTLSELEDWGGHVRSALFVARGTLEAERERIVVEANALGSAVLGETLGASSVALVRRRLQERLG
jgi:chromosome segregation ATPase